MKIADFLMPGSLRWRLVATAVLVEVVMLVALVWGAMYVVERELVVQAQQRVTELRPLLSASTLRAVLEEDVVALQEIASRFVRNDRVSHFAAYNAIGDRLAAVGGGSLPASNGPNELALDVAEYLEANPQARSYPMRVMVESNGRRFGRLEVAIDIGAIHETRDAVRRQGTAIGLVAIVLTGLLLGAIGLALTRRLAVLAQGAQAIASGDLDVQVPDLGRDEIGQTAASFNNMVRRVADAQHELRASEARTRLLLESSGESIYGVDRDGLCIFANPACVQALGYEDSAQLVGRDLHALMHPAHDDCLGPDCLLVRTYRHGEGAHVVLIAARRDGSRFSASLTSAPLVQDGERVGAVVTFRDITARLRIEAELAHFRRILDETLDMIFMFDPRTLRFVYANRGAVEKMGYTREELLALRPCDIKPQHPEPIFRDLIAPLLTGSKPSLSFESVYRRKDGSEFPVEVFIQKIDIGNESRCINLVRDISERKQVERLKNEFVATVSHELRTPLTSIRGALGLLAGGVIGPLPEEATTLIGIAASNSKRLILLINDILDIEKIESGKLDFEFGVHELTPLVKQMIEANRAYADHLGVSLALTATLESAHVWVDPERLIQALTNLVSNSAKFSPAGGRVEVALSRDGTERLRVTVTDHGPGIPAEFRTRIFQKFAQADGSDTRRSGGTGLGLSIAKALVEHMGGSIGFESQPGAGSSFYIDLPEVSTAVTARHLLERDGRQATRH